MNYRNDSPNPATPGKRMLSTVELIRKRAKLRLEHADLGVKAGQARVDGNLDTLKDLRLQQAELARRVAVIDVRLGERIVSV
jgi:hypothetical protein